MKEEVIENVEKIICDVVGVDYFTLYKKEHDINEKNLAKYLCYYFLNKVLRVSYTNIAKRTGKTMRSIMRGTKSISERYDFDDITRAAFDESKKKILDYLNSREQI